MKTPAEVAAALYPTLSLPASPTGADLRAVMAAAIEADRAQRQGRLDDLYAYDWKPEGEDADGTMDTEITEPITIVEIDTPAGIGRMRVYLNDGRIYDGDPETGQEWSLT